MKNQMAQKKTQSEPTEGSGTKTKEVATVDEHRAQILVSKDGVAELGRWGLICQSVLEGKAGSPLLLESIESLMHIADFAQKLHAAVVKLFVLESEAGCKKKLHSECSVRVKSQYVRPFPFALFGLRLCPGGRFFVRKAAPCQELVVSCAGKIEAATTAVANAFHQLEALSGKYPDVMSTPDWVELEKAMRHLLVLQSVPAARCQGHCWCLFGKTCVR